MPATIITSQFLLSIGNVKFSNGNDVNNYFTTKSNMSYINWFNANIGAKENWLIAGGKGIKMASDPDAQNRFNQLWNQIPVMFGTSPINLLQFISLMSIVNNETGGTLKPRTEIVNSVTNPNNPGIAYAFNKILNVKRSYNTLISNKTAYDLFHDVNYKQAHGNLVMANQLKDTTNIAWKGEVYPAGVSASTDPLATGFILEADFYKFRGRGFIQTTTRGNYRAIIDFVQKYSGSNAIINQYKSKWLGKDTDTAATISSNADWDALFQSSDLIIPSVAINIHSKSAGNYLSKITLQTGVDANIRTMGKSISGGNDYADLFLKRVIQICNGLGNA